MLHAMIQYECPLQTVEVGSKSVDFMLAVRYVVNLSSQLIKDLQLMFASILTKTAFIL